MLNSIHRALIPWNLSVNRIANPVHYNPCHFQQHPFSSAISQPISIPTNQDSFTVDYLVKTFGFSQEKASNASNYLKASTTRNAESVKAFLENQGLTTEQIGAVVRFFPTILKCDPAKNLLPKVEYFRSLGIPQSEVNGILLTSPAIFGRSLSEQIIPTFTYIKALFESSGTRISFTDRLGGILNCDLESQLIPNVETLRDAGVPDSWIISLLQKQPKALNVDSEKFRKVVEEVKQMNICPSKIKFIQAVIVLRSLTKSTWDTKVAAYKRWGWSDDDVILAFQKDPNCMRLSTDKITRCMDYIVNEMRLDSSFLLKNPILLSFSLEKRIKPRCRVYKVLVENGLIKEGSNLPYIFNVPEDKFLKRFVHKYGTQAPLLLQLYHEKLDVSESSVP